MAVNKDNDTNMFIRFSPAIIAVVAFIITYKIVATPQYVKDEIDTYKEYVSRTYATKEETKNLQRQYDNISVKIDRIYDYIITAKR